MTASVNDQSAPRMSLIKDGIAAQLTDLDPEETDEWLGSFDAMVDAGGAAARPLPDAAAAGAGQAAARGAARR